jgi:hypothetical protein
MLALAPEDLDSDGGRLFRPLQADQQKPAIALNLDVEEVSLADPSLLPGLGRDDHLPAIIDGSCHGFRIMEAILPVNTARDGGSDGPSVLDREFDLVTVADFIDANDRPHITHRRPDTITV